MGTKKLKDAQDEIEKMKAKTIALMDALTGYQDIYPSRLKITFTSNSANDLLGGLYKIIGLDGEKCPIYKHTSSEIYLRRSFEWDAGENNLIKCFESNDPADKL